MQYLFKPLYISSVKKLDRIRAEKVQNAFEKIVMFFETGKLQSDLGLKQLRPDIWEIRAGLLDRIIFKREKDTVMFLICDTHNKIKRFLKNL